jgi:hypothetical protein
MHLKDRENYITQSFKSCTPSPNIGKPNKSDELDGSYKTEDEMTNPTQNSDQICVYMWSIQKVRGLGS